MAREQTLTWPLRAADTSGHLRFLAADTLGNSIAWTTYVFRQPILWDNLRFQAADTLGKPILRDTYAFRQPILRDTHALRKPILPDSCSKCSCTGF
jgi:hypothetical protein